jgi:hypothetical protein
VIAKSRMPYVSDIALPGDSRGAAAADSSEETSEDESGSGSAR